MSAPHPSSAPRALGADARSNVVGTGLPHDSAALHASGAADYTDDLPEPRGTLHVALGTSPVAHGRLNALDLEPVRAAPGVVDVIAAADIPGENDVGPIQHDDPIFAAGLVQFVGQPVFAVAATSVNAARRAARLARFDIESLPAILTIDAALAAQSWVLPPVHVTRGDAAAAMAAVAHHSADCDSLPPKPPPMRRHSTTTSCALTPSARATICCTSPGCCVDVQTCMPPRSRGTASAIWPSR